MVALFQSSGKNAVLSMQFSRCNKSFLLSSDRFFSIILCILSCLIALLLRFPIPYLSSRSIIFEFRPQGSVLSSCFLMYFQALGCLGRLHRRGRWRARILALSFRSVVWWRVVGSIKDDEKESGTAAPFIQTFANAHIFVRLLFGFRLSMCFFGASSFAFKTVFFLCASFSLQGSLFDSHLIPPLFGSHAFLAFLY